MIVGALVRAGTGRAETLRFPLLCSFYSRLAIRGTPIVPKLLVAQATAGLRSGLDGRGRPSLHEPWYSFEHSCA